MSRIKRLYIDKTNFNIISQICLVLLSTDISLGQSYLFVETWEVDHACIKDSSNGIYVVYVKRSGIFN